MQKIIGIFSLILVISCGKKNPQFIDLATGELAISGILNPDLRKQTVMLTKVESMANEDYFPEYVNDAVVTLNNVGLAVWELDDERYRDCWRLDRNNNQCGNYVLENLPVMPDRNYTLRIIHDGKERELNTHIPGTFTLQKNTDNSWTWTKSEKAAQYHIALFDDNWDMVFERYSQSTSVSIDEKLLTPGEYKIRVTALDSNLASWARLQEDTSSGNDLYGVFGSIFMQELDFLIE